MDTLETRAPIDAPVIETRRIYEFPVEEVFDAFAKVENISQWWGPTGFSCLENDFKFENGGHWNFVMHHDERGDYINRTSYTNIIENELIEFSLGDDVNPSMFKARISFESDGNSTILHMKMTFPTIEERDEKVRDVGALEGQKQTFDRLSEYLKSK